MLTTFALLAMAGGAMSLMGWLQVTRSPGRASVHFELQRMQADLHDAYLGGQQWMHEQISHFRPEQQKTR